MTDPWKGMGAKVLRGVAELFAEPGRWTQGAWARDVDGAELVRVHDTDAVCWCLLGAIRKVAGPGCAAAENEAREAVRTVLRNETDASIAGWNDSPRRSVDDVIRVAARAAIALESAR